MPTLVGSGLSGQAYATGDVDAIFGGSPETFTRDLQWKAFTPVLMGMSGWSANARKHPWWFDEPYRSINRRYLKLKLRLTPYMYTLAREAEQTGAPLVRGLMWDYASDPAAFTEAHKYQFLLGRDMLVAPVYRSQAVSQGWRKAIHLTQGTWFEYWDGRACQRIPMKNRVAVNNTDAYRAACVAGLGIIQAPALGARDLIDAGKLVEILPDFQAPSIPVSLLYPHKRNLSKRVRIFMDWLSEVLKQHLT